MNPLPLLDHRLAGSRLADWLTALGVAIVVALVIGIVRRVAARRLMRWARATPSRLDDIVVGVLGSTKGSFSVAVGLWAGSQYVDLSTKAERWLRVAVSLIVLVQVGIWLQAAIQRSVDSFGSAPGEDNGARTRATAVTFITRLVIWVVVFVSALSMMGFQISALVAGLGAGGVAAALAVQSLLGDLIASLSMFFDRPFDLGDFIVVGAEQGTVERIGMRSTRVRALSGEEIVFANGDLIKSRIRNFKRMQERRVAFGFGVDYETSAEQVEQIAPLVRRVIEAREGVRFDRAHFREYGAMALEFEVVFFVLSNDMTVHLDHRQAINIEILRQLRTLGVTLVHQPSAQSLRRLGPAAAGEIAGDPPATS